MSEVKSNPRPYLSGDHLRGLASGPTGSVMVRPLSTGDIYFDAASANHLPRNLPEGDHGSTIVDIGRGVSIRASGKALLEDGIWQIRHLHASQYPTGRSLTAQQTARAIEVLSGLITSWADTHMGDIAQADDITRNNACRTLEETILRHENALEILRSQLSACEEGEPYSQYPDIPTDRR